MGTAKNVDISLILNIYCKVQCYLWINFFGSFALKSEDLVFNRDWRRKMEELLTSDRKVIQAHSRISALSS